MDIRIISIGTLSVHELWQQQGPARTPHATCTLIQTRQRRILVDPGLPAQVITARLAERSGLQPDDINDIFLTSFRPAHRWGLEAFPHARWLISETEREAIGQSLVHQFQQSEQEQQQNALKQDIALLQRCEPAPDQLADKVDLFPLHGPTPGHAGLILSFPQTTWAVAGDAIPTVEHLEQGRVSRNVFDADQAQQSFKEVLEIADMIIPGHDNILASPSRRF